MTEENVIDITKLLEQGKEKQDKVSVLHNNSWIKAKSKYQGKTPGLDTAANTVKDYIANIVMEYHKETKSGDFSQEQATGAFFSLMKGYGVSPEEVIQQIKEGNQEMLDEYKKSTLREKTKDAKEGHFFSNVRPLLGAGLEGKLAQEIGGSKEAKTMVARDAYKVYQKAEQQIATHSYLKAA